MEVEKLIELLMQMNPKEVIYAYDSEGDVCRIAGFMTDDVGDFVIVTTTEDFDPTNDVIK